MLVIFFHLANISIVNKGLPVVFCKGFSCVLRMTYIITRQIRSPIHSVSFSHRAHVCKTRGEVILSRRTFFSLTLGSFISHREHGGHGGFKHTYSFVESFFSHRAHRSNRTFWRTISSPQKASGIQSSQSLSAIIITNKGHNEGYILFIGVSR